MTLPNHGLGESRVAPHGADEEAHVAHRHIGEGVRPVFEHALVETLGPLQMRALIGRDARVEDVVVAALDDVDGVDLHIAEMLDRQPRRLGVVAERRRMVEPLGREPDAARFGDGKRMRLWW